MNSWARALCRLSLAAGLAASLAGCRARLVDTTIVNRGPALRLLEFDYPSASFGADVLPAGATFRHGFLIDGSGPLTLHFEDAAGKTHTSEGPTVKQGQQGSLTVTIDDKTQSVQWNPQLTGP